MILTGLTLINYGVFRGTQHIPLTPKPARPIILFGGKNGSGKSTLLEAIQLCLYGQKAFHSFLSKESYLLHLEGKIHSNPGLIIQPHFSSIALEFQYSDTEGMHTYSVCRSWEKKDGQHLNEYLDVKRDGKGLDELAGEHWQDFVRDLIPPGVSQFFFFDGEKIQQLAKDSPDEGTLAQAIKTLLGLDLIERLQSDLEIYSSRMDKQNSATLSPEIDSLQGEARRLRIDLEEKRKLRVDEQGRVNDLREKISRVEGQIGAEGGGFAKNREGLLEKKVRLQALIDHHEKVIRDLCEGLLPFAVVPKLLGRLQVQILREEKIVRLEAGKEMLKTGRDKLLKRLTEVGNWNELKNFTLRQKKQIQERLRGVVSESLKGEARERANLIHSGSAIDRQSLIRLIVQSEDIPSIAKKSGIELEKLYRELHAVIDSLRKVPAEESLKPLLIELHSLHENLAEAGQSVIKADEETRVIEGRLQECERKYRQASERLAQEASVVSRTHLAIRIQGALDRYKTALLDRKVRELQSAVSDCFNTLCRKKDNLRRIAVNSKDFSVMLYDQRGHSLPKERLSAGEKQIYAISMLWALAKTSQRPLPMIIDTPLARLDSDHRNLLVKYYFPAASHQVIILSTDTEVDQTYVEALEGYISHTYCVEFSQMERASTIVPGYF